MGEEEKQTFRWYINGEEVAYEGITEIGVIPCEDLAFKSIFTGSIEFTAESSEENAEILRESFGIMNQQRIWDENVRIYAMIATENQRIINLANYSKKFRVRKKNARRFYDRFYKYAKFVR